MKKLLPALIIIICTITQAQDIHFSQFYQSPLQMNPSLAGAIGGSHRFHLNYRSQWASIGSPFKTFGASYDLPVMRDEWDAGFLGVGLHIYSDKAGDSDMGTLYVAGSTSGHVYAGTGHIISAGFQVAYVERSLSYDELYWDNQFQGGVFNPTLPTGETQWNTKHSFIDMGAGISWSYAKEDAMISSGNALKINAGIAAYHFHNPKKSFREIATDTLNTRWLVHAGAKIGITNTRYAIQPVARYMMQGKLNELMLGVLLGLHLKEESKFTGAFKDIWLSIGTYYRAGDALIPTLQIEAGEYFLGISYDYNISDLTAASSGKGGIEIAARYTILNNLGGGRGFSRVGFY